jgi:hypothetical protein
MPTLRSGIYWVDYDLDSANPRVSIVNESGEEDEDVLFLKGDTAYLWSESLTDAQEDACREAIQAFKYGKLTKLELDKVLVLLGIIPKEKP